MINHLWITMKNTVQYCQVKFADLLDQNSFSDHVSVEEKFLSLVLNFLVSCKPDSSHNMVC